MISEIIQYFKNKRQYKTTQHIIGMKLLFWGFVLQDWKGNTETLKYCKSNKVLVCESTKFYIECWLNRNEIYYLEEKQKNILKKWSQTCKEYTMELGGNVKAYIDAHPLKENAIIEYRWE